MTRIAKIVLILVALFALVAVASASTGDLSSASNKLAIFKGWASTYGIDSFGVSGADLDLYLVKDRFQVTGASASFLSYHSSCAADTRISGFSGTKADAWGRVPSTNTYVVFYAGTLRYLCGQ